MATVRMRALPRGLRNNNPLNIRIGNTWLGERSCPTDPEFEEFVSIAYGYRAAFCILRRYIRRYHKDTIRAIVTTWAPPVENHTTKYIDFVAKAVGIAPDTHLLYEDRDTMTRVVAAMSHMECGVPAIIDDVKRGYDMA